MTPFTKAKNTLPAWQAPTGMSAFFASRPEFNYKSGSTDGWSSPGALNVDNSQYNDWLKHGRGIGYLPQEKKSFLDRIDQGVSAGVQGLTMAGIGAGVAGGFGYGPLAGGNTTSGGLPGIESFGGSGTSGPTAAEFFGAAPATATGPTLAGMFGAAPAAAAGGAASWAVPAAIGGGSLLQYLASQQAADAQSDAADRAAQSSDAQYAQTREDLAPWRDAGGSALAKLEEEMRNGNLLKPFGAEDFTQDPGYEFRLSEGEKAINRAAAARGSWDSGGTGKALTRYAQDYASGEYGNAYNRYNTDQSNIYNRLAGLAGTGQTATVQTGQFGQGAVGQSNDALLSGAAARGAGAVGGASAINSGLSNYLNYMNESRLMDFLMRGYKNAA